MTTSGIGRLVGSGRAPTLALRVPSEIQRTQTIGPALEEWWFGTAASAGGGGGGVTGTGAATLAGVTGAATAIVVVTSVGATTLAGVVGTASGSVVVTGTAAATLEDLVGAAQGGIVPVGVGAATLDAVVGVAVGQHGSVEVTYPPRLGRGVAGRLIR